MFLLVSVFADVDNASTFNLDRPSTIQRSRSNPEVGRRGGNTDPPPLV